MAKTLDAAGVKRLIQEIKGANKNLNAPIPISTENTPESMAQNVKNIADYVAKAKAAGIASVNGMAVTCLIDNDYSGVGYLYGDTSICGIEIFDDSTSPMYFKVDPDGTYGEVAILMENNTDIVTSDMLVEGARKPIIITGDMTEVDEETYQKLLSDDVDVVFNTINMTTKDIDSDKNITMTFSYTICTVDIIQISSIDIQISSTSPHLVVKGDPAEQIISPEQVVNKSTLSPILQEIYLAGTDAQIKAKLDQFETDWKALTGADDLTGARFVGIMNTPTGELSTIFAWNSMSSFYEGVGTDDVGKIYKIQVDPSDGNIHLTPLFSHLEAITIKTGNTPEKKAANVAAIKAYVDNLNLLGVDTTKGYMIPAKLDTGLLDGFVSYHSDTADYPWSGVFIKPGGSGKFVGINKDGLVVSIPDILISGDIYTALTTTSKGIIPAINEVNANAVHSDKLVPTLEAITIKTGNAPEDRAANKAVIEAYRDNLTALGVDATKGFMIPIKSIFGNGFILFDGTKGEGYVKINNDCYGITIDAHYAVAVNNLVSTITNYSYLETTSKRVLPAINEVNALAKGYSTIFTPIELTTETAQNKTAIDARVAAFTAQGISLTNGCCIPVTYKGVYAGNISLINGDWYGLLVKNTNNPADNINIKLSADGTITEGNSAQ